MNTNSAKKQSGVSLIEVLVAVVLISIGFLAVAKMQVAGMRHSQSAYFSSQATMMLKDITDRMRSNRVGVDNGYYDTVVTNTTATVPACVASNTPCSPQEMATKDIAEWSAYLHPPAGMNNFTAALPTAPNIKTEGSVTKNIDVYDIRVQWGEKIDGEFETQTLSVQFVP